MESIRYVPRNGWPEGLELHSVIIPGYPTMSINEAGHIRSCSLRGGGIGDKWVTLTIRQAPVNDPDAPWTFRFNDGKRLIVTVASLVMMVHGTEKPSGDHELCALDGDLTNHCLWNLAWMTRQERAGRPYFPKVNLRHLHKDAQDRAYHAWRSAQVMGQRQKPIRGAVPQEELFGVLAEWEQRGCSLRTIWEERFRDRCDFPTFSNRTYRIRKQRKK